MTPEICRIRGSPHHRPPSWTPVDTSAVTARTTRQKLPARRLSGAAPQAADRARAERSARQWPRRRCRPRGAPVLVRTLGVHRPVHRGVHRGVDRPVPLGGHPVHTSTRRPAASTDAPRRQADRSTRPISRDPRPRADGPPAFSRPGFPRSFCVPSPAYRPRPGQPGQAAGPPRPRSRRPHARIRTSRSTGARRARADRAGPDIRRSNTTPAHSGQREHPSANTARETGADFARILALRKPGGTGPCGFESRTAGTASPRISRINRRKSFAPKR